MESKEKAQLAAMEAYLALKVIGYYNADQLYRDWIGARQEWAFDALMQAAHNRGVDLEFVLG